VTLSLSTASAVGAQIYKWVDENGTMHFSQSPPAASRRDVAVIHPSEHRPMVTDQPRAATENPISVSRRRRNNDFVELYVTKWCMHCRRARAFLNEEDIPFVEYDIEEEPWAAEHIRELTGRSGVPVAVFGEKVVRGFSAASYRRALDAWPGP